MPITINTPPAQLPEYFKSIKEDFRQTYESLLRKKSFSKIEAIPQIFLMFSVVPGVPYVLYYLSKNFGWQFALGPLNIPTHSFIFWWIFSTGLSGLSLVVVQAIRDRGFKGKELLRERQFRFALCYATIEELTNFQKNHRNLHIQRALEYESRLADSLPGYLVSRNDSPTYSDRHFDLPFRDSIEFLRRYSWFKLDPTSEQILQAFRKYRQRVIDRIKDQKDLGQVIAVFTSLALFLYSEIPEVEEEDGTERIAEMGNSGVVRFAELTDSLPPYKAERKPTTVEEKIQQKVSNNVGRLTYPFVHENLFICFLSWLLFISILVSGIVFVASRFVSGFRLDSTLLAVMIATPFGGAATLTALSRQSNKNAVPTPTRIENVAEGDES